jgi:hypothetical protein
VARLLDFLELSASGLVLGVALLVFLAWVGSLTAALTESKES